jgi:pectin methylesterase-like acyl-CoA thioesterase
MKRWTRIALAAVLCGVVASGAWAQSGKAATQPATSAPSGPSFYVDANNPAAADTNPGTAERPWKTIQQAAKTMVAGDTTIVKAGTYREQVMVNAHSGEPNKLITFKANPGDTVVIDGNNTRQFGFRVSASYIRIDGF